MLKTKLTFGVLFLLSFFVLPATVSASCTYQATITNNHLDINVISDQDAIDFINFIDRPQPQFTITNVYGPEVGQDWYVSQYDGDYFYSDIPVINIQNRFTNNDSVFWNRYDFINDIPWKMPSGVYGFDFVGTLTYDDFYIEYGTYFGGVINPRPDSWTPCTRVGDINQSDVDSSHYKFSSTPTPTSITKTVLVPGLGASWNTEAFLGCQNNTTSEWNLSSFAEDIYNPIIQTLTDSGWTTLPFYYDWRQTVSTNSERLANYINGNSIQDEKVNLVGHSMGGLVGRGYLETSSGGKLSSLLTVGTPNKGSALAYPPWEGGDIWNDNFIEKMAITLYLKHCGGIGPTNKDTIQNLIPSLKDLLPTEAYLQKNNITTPYLPVNSNNQNIWLTDLPNNPWGVRLGYVAGTGFDTLKTIKTKDPNKRDSKLGNWEDGKPAGKIFSSDGDGTILADSAILPSADISYLINQTHEGLINSIEGMSKILEFLGTPQISNQQTLSSDTSEVNSALIVIADPASFTVTDQNGKTKVAKDGMVSFVNPNSGNYKLNLLPKSNNTLFIVAQFLPNGDVKYKEYNLKGLGPKFKTLKFSLQEAQDDILIP